MARNQFVDALKLFLDTADPGELENLAVRLKPYRITSLQVQRPDGTPSARSIPVIVLDDGRQTQTSTPSLEEEIKSLTEATQSISMPRTSTPTLNLQIHTPPDDSYFDFNTLSWGPSPVPENGHLSMADMILDEHQLADLSGDLVTAGGPSYFHAIQQQARLPITPPYSDLDFLDSNTGSPTDPCSPSTFLDSSITASSPSSDPFQFDLPSTSTTSTPRALRTQAKTNRRRRPRRNTAASITHAIISNSLPSSPPRNPAAAAALVFTSCLRKDYLDFLKTNLPEWVKDGLWRTSSLNNHNDTTNNTPTPRPCFMMMGSSNTLSSHRPGSATGSSTYGFLENIYSCVSQLDSRIEIDQVRKRVALVLLHSEYLESYQDWKETRHHSPLPPPSSQKQAHVGLLPGGDGGAKGGVGRGDMTLMIDNILEQTTPNWGELGSKRKLQLRALFHERKRYGKRWSVFREEIGAAILLICSGQLSNMVSNTKVTMAALKGISHTIHESEPIMEVLRVLEPLAQALVNNDGYMNFGRGQRSEQVVQLFETLQVAGGYSTGVGEGSDDEDMDY